MGPGAGQNVANPAGGGLTYKARSVQTGGALTAWESTAAPGEGPPLHLHLNGDEFMYVLEGRLRFRLDETDHAAPDRLIRVHTEGSPPHGRTPELDMPGFCSF
jgi:mannose-6-phosphate isomerase-like protein (cupin superfamily)